MKFQEIVDAFDRCQTRTLRLCGATGRHIELRYQNKHLQDYPIYESLTEPISVGIGIHSQWVFAKFHLPNIRYSECRAQCPKDGNLDGLAKQIYQILGGHFRNATKEAEKHLISVVVQDKLQKMIPLGTTYDSRWHKSVGITRRIGHDDRLEINISEFHRLSVVCSLSFDDLNIEVVSEIEPFIKKFDELMVMAEKLSKKYKMEKM